MQISSVLFSSKVLSISPFISSFIFTILLLRVFILSFNCEWTTTGLSYLYQDYKSKWSILIFYNNHLHSLPGSRALNMLAKQPRENIPKYKGLSIDHSYLLQSSHSGTIRQSSPYFGLSLSLSLLPAVLDSSICAHGALHPHTSAPS